jgi:hypothetical protein
VIAVVTCKRQGVDYLPATLAAVDASATGRRVLVSDDLAYQPRCPSTWELVTFLKPESVTGRPENRWALWKCFELAAQAGEDLIVLEDDLELCANAALRMEHIAVPDDCAFLTFFSCHGRGLATGIHRTRMHSFAFAQALKFPARTVLEMHAAFDEMANDPRRPGSDDCLQRMGSPRGWLYGTHYPNLVQHVGDVSAVGNHVQGSRRSETFPGVAFDARTLHHWQFD